MWRGAVLGLLFTGSSLWADDPPKKDDPPTKQEPKLSPAEQFAKAKKTFDDASAAMNKVVAEIQKKKEKLTLENKELNAAFQARNKATDELVKAAGELAKAEPATKQGLEAISAMVTYGPPMLNAEMLKILSDHHAMNPKIGEIVSRVSRGPSNKDLEALLTLIMEKNPSRDAQGNAAFTLATMKMRNKNQHAEAEKLLEKIVAEYKDVKYFRGTLADRAESSLFELRHLQIGKVAPDIEGEDMDGKTFKLSDYRGKVVMLDFWGHW
ncbi:MAG TPA: redoxin domain-containing protein [Gemmatales bacterium]|nr:redoxin domain-containing protein [Gemmatales bacterium]